MTAVGFMLAGAIVALAIRGIAVRYRTPVSSQTGTGAGLPLALLVVRADRDARADISRAIERDDDRTRWN